MFFVEWWYNMLASLGKYDNNLLGNAKTTLSNLTPHTTSTFLQACTTRMPRSYSWDSTTLAKQPSYTC